MGKTMTRKGKPTPPQDLLLRLLRYDPEAGKLYWRPRPIEMFKDGKLHSRSHAWRKWNTRYAGKEAFTALVEGYRYGAVHHRQYRACRIIFKMLHGYDPPYVGHKNGDRLDDRADNLASVTAYEMQVTKAMQSNNKSGVVGVYWDRHRKKWVAQLRHKRQTIHLGRHIRIEDAVAARREGEREYGRNNYVRKPRRETISGSSSQNGCTQFSS
jgi:hypothetical protein